MFGPALISRSIFPIHFVYFDRIEYNFHSVGFGYVSQTPWLQRGTIRENIIWGSVYDENRYRRTLFACALLEDIATLGGDEVGVGEGGRTLSGGQRARVALARAVYQDKKSASNEHRFFNASVNFPRFQFTYSTMY